MNNPTKAYNNDEEFMKSSDYECYAIALVRVSSPNQLASSITMCISAMSQLTNMMHHIRHDGH